MLSAEAMEYTARAIIQQIAGNTLKVNEYCEFINKAIQINKLEPKWTSCKYWHNGEKVQAKIDFRTGRIVDLSGKELRKGNIVN